MRGPEVAPASGVGKQVVIKCILLAFIFVVVGKEMASKVFEEETGEINSEVDMK